MGNYLYNLTYGITNTYITSITNPITTLSNLTIDNSDGFIINIFVNSNLHAFDTTSNKNTMESITNLLFPVGRLSGDISKFIMLICLYIVEKG